MTGLLLEFQEHAALVGRYVGRLYLLLLEAFQDALDEHHGQLLVRRLYLLLLHAFQDALQKHHGQLLSALYALQEHHGQLLPALVDAFQKCRASPGAWAHTWGRQFDLPEQLKV